MPKPTFRNLPHEKRERFVDAALDEFTRHPYDVASVSRVVNRLGIAKGSIYQYFSDKFDLFRWLVGEALERRGDVQPPPNGAAPFEALRARATATLGFWQAEPRWACLLLRLQDPSSEERVTALARETRERELEALTTWARAAQERGAVRGDVEPSTLAPLLYALLDRGLARSYREGREPSEAAEDVADGRAEALASLATELLERGITA